MIIDQSPEDGFEHESLGEHLSMWPVIGQAVARLVQIAPTSTIRGEYDQAFAPGYNISSGFDNPDQPVDDLRAMTYTALKDTVNAEQDYVDQSPLDRRLEALHVPLLVIFGAEDQIYDAQAAIARYRQVPGRPDAPDPRRGPLPQRREAGPRGAPDPCLREASAGADEAEEAPCGIRSRRQAAAQRKSRRQGRRSEIGRPGRR